MTEWHLSVNTPLLERDIMRMRQNISEIYRSMEILEAGLSDLRGFWEGEAQEVFFQNVYKSWEQLEDQRKGIENRIVKLERICSVYKDCDRRVMDKMAVLLI